MTELLELSAARQAELLRRGELSAAELFEFWRGRAAGDELGAYLWVADEPPAEAGELPPFAAKDLFCVEGVPSSAGSRILEGYRPPYTATSVRNLQAAGAPVLGKTNQDEFAMGSSNENSGYGPVQNPWDRTRVPGGSSGGSAAAVAAGYAPWAIGTDTGGSIRQPASLCGIVGMKPTYGAISRYGMIAFASSLDQCGPLTRDVTDAALMLRHPAGPRPLRLDLARHPGRDPAAERRAARRPALRRLGARGGGPRAGRGRCRAGHAREDRGAGRRRRAGRDAERRARAVRLLRDRAGRGERQPGPLRRRALRPSRSGNGDLTEMYEQTRHDGFGDEVKRRIMIGTYALSSGYYEAYYGKAQKVRTKIVEDFRAAFEKVDFLVTPTSPTVAFKLGERTADPLAMYLSDYFTVPMPLAGTPAISIPAGLSDGLPVGFQIAGPAFSEAGILEAAYALEQAIGFEGVPVVERERRPATSRSSASRSTCS